MISYMLIGVLNAADYYGLEDLRKACTGFVQCCINVDTVCALLSSAERYIQYKCTKSLVQKVTYTYYIFCCKIWFTIFGRHDFQRLRWIGFGICWRTWKRSVKPWIIRSITTTRGPVDIEQRWTKGRRIH